VPEKKPAHGLAFFIVQGLAAIDRAVGRAENPRFQALYPVVN
jgi:hypothetical protein